MIGPIQLQPSTAIAQAAIAGLSLKPGQLLDALVLSKLPDGAVALKIGQIVVNAQVSKDLPPGSLLQLRVTSVVRTPQFELVGTPRLPAATLVQQVHPLVQQLSGTPIVESSQAPVAVRADVASALPAVETGAQAPGGTAGSAGPQSPGRPPSPVVPAQTRATAQAYAPMPSVGSPAAAPPGSLAAVVAGQSSAYPPVPQGVTEAKAVAEPASPTPLLIAQGATRPGSAVAETPGPPAMAPVAPMTPRTTPAAALIQMIPEAMGRQNSMAPLFVSLAAAVGHAGMLPEPVLRAALQLLAQRVQVAPGGPTGEQVETAIARSGVFLEASLAKGVAPPADLKAGLIALKEAVASWIGHSQPVESAKPVAPPLRGVPPRATLADQSGLPDAPGEVGRVLHHQADAAVARVKLMQFASLPDADPARATVPELRMEVPFLIGQQLVPVQFQLVGDGKRGRQERERGWTMRFAMHLQGVGEVGADIGLIGRTVSVALWAGEAETAAGLQAALPELAPALGRLGLNPGAIRVRARPPEPGKQGVGQYLDSRR